MRIQFILLNSSSGIKPHDELLNHCIVRSCTASEQQDQTGARNNYQLLDEVEQNIVICHWRADQLFAEAEGCGK